VPPNKNVVVRDLVRGDVTFNTDTLGDFVVMRSNGLPVLAPSCSMCCMHNSASLLDSVTISLLFVSGHFFTLNCCLCGSLGWSIHAVDRTCTCLPVIIYATSVSWH
jgi:hypothetical protein